MKTAKEFAKDLLRFIDKSPSCYHAVATSAEILQKKDFKYISLNEPWKLEKFGKYYTTINDSAIVAFTLGEKNGAYKLVGAHTDSPSFRIKERPQLMREGFVQLNVEPYGGLITSTWFDRPLSVAGRVFLEGSDPYRPEMRLIDLQRDLLIIENIAIHLDAGAPEGKKTNIQKEMMPILALGENKGKDYLKDLISSRLHVEPERILAWDLYLYDRSKGCLLGANEEFISAGKLDNLAMVHCGIKAISDGEEGEDVRVFVGFDNEEVGSRTMQGAGSVMLSDLLDRIGEALGRSSEEQRIARANSLLISADMAHSVHPNYTEKSDPVNKPLINKGPVIKSSGSKSYTSDGYSMAVLSGIAREAGVATQVFTNRSDARGGSTIGPISEAGLGIKGVDVGNPILGMHSIRELGGVQDHYAMYKLFKKFYEISG